MRVVKFIFTLSAKLLQYRFLIRASHQRLSDENSIGTILLESRDILSGLHAALRYEEDVLRHQFPQPHGIMDIHRKIFQIPVIDTDDPRTCCKRHLHFLLVMGFHQCRQSKFSCDSRIL